MHVVQQLHLFGELQTTGVVVVVMAVVVVVVVVVVVAPQFWTLAS